MSNERHIQSEILHENMMTTDVESNVKWSEKK